MKQTLLIHVFCCTSNNLIPQECNDLKELHLKEYGFYYEFNNDDHFKLIAHSENNPYQENKGMFYVGPINPEEFMMNMVNCSNDSNDNQNYFQGVVSQDHLCITIENNDRSETAHSYLPHYYDNDGISRSAYHFTH